MVMAVLDQVRFLLNLISSNTFSTIISAGFVVILVFVPETLPHTVISRAHKEAPSIDGSTPSIAVSRISLLMEIRFIFTMALRILITEPIVTFLGIYNGYAYGLVFLLLDGSYDVYAINNGLTPLQASITFLNFMVGVTFLFVFIPIQTIYFSRDRARRGGIPRPEARFMIALYAVWLYPIALFWFAFTSDGNVSYWSPILAGAVIGFVDPLLYLCMLNYITDSYSNVAASAVAAFLVPSFLGAAGFAHIGLILFENMSTTWGVAILAFISLPLVGLVYVVYFFGPQIRARSKLARNF
jgi:hypothetical protein